MNFALAPRPGNYNNASQDPTVVGLFSAASGIGESARLCADAIVGLGFNPDIIDLSSEFGQVDINASRFNAAEAKNTGPIIIHLNPPELPKALRTIGRRRLAGRKIIGYWAWELSEAPASWLRTMQLVHEVWTPSTFCTNSISTGAVVPVKTVPHIVASPTQTKKAAKIGKTAFHVIAAGDARSSLTRKNLRGAISAFRHAFGDDPDVQLTIRIRHGSRSDPSVLAFQALCSEFTNVQVHTSTLDEASEHEFIASADVLLALHRSEGFGLALAKAMLAGRPVIATAWSGNMDFMTPETACLVRSKLIDVVDCQNIYPQAGQQWAEPNIDEAVAWLKKLRENPILRSRIGQAASEGYPSERFYQMLKRALVSC